MAIRAIAPGSANHGVLFDSTSGLLAGSATYTSNTYRIEGFARITGICMSDQAGTINIDQSADATNWDYSTSVSVTASTGAAISVEVVAGFVRIRFTNNGVSTQTVMRLSTYVRAV